MCNDPFSCYKNMRNAFFIFSKWKTCFLPLHILRTSIWHCLHNETETTSNGLSYLNTFSCYSYIAYMTLLLSFACWRADIQRSATAIDYSHIQRVGRCSYGVILLSVQRARYNFNLSRRGKQRFDQPTHLW